MTFRPARTLTELYQAVKPDESLPPDDERHVDLGPARGDENPVAQIERRVIVSRPPDYHCCLLTGHRGSGKSTELRRLQADLERQKFLVAMLDVQVTLDLADVEYLDVLLAIAQSLENVARKHNLELSQNLLQDVTDWFFSAEIVTREEVRESERILGADYALGVQAPLFAKMMATLTSKIRTGSNHRKQIRIKVERRLEDLVSRLNMLVDNVREQAKKAGYHRGLVIIVDSLEKMMLKKIGEQRMTNHAMLFVEHAEHLRGLPCHTVYTVPVSLLHDRNLNNTYENVHLIPMVKVATPQHEHWDAGRDLLYQVVEKRLDIDAIFADSQLVYRLIDASGGVVRDLMHLILYAADYVPIDTRINEQAVEKAIRKLVRIYDLLIHKKDLELLLEISKNPHVGISSEMTDLMYNRLVLPYDNDENWRDVHPAVRQAATFRAYIRQQMVRQQLEEQTAV